jgi:hypothetical protein
MSNEVLTTAQAAEFLSVSPATLRTWKSRKADLLVEGTHWINQDGTTLWTQAGLEALQGVSPETASVADSETVSVSGDPLGRYSPLVRSVAEAITQGLLGRIDNAVTDNIRSAIAKPMTSTECVTLLNELGLKPCNPELLISSNVAGLLEGKEN